MTKQDSRLKVKIKTKVRHFYFERRHSKPRLEDHEARPDETHSYKIIIGSLGCSQKHII